MLPITGPFSKTDYLNGPPVSSGFKPRWYERSSTWYRQKAPYDRPLPYAMYVRRVQNYSYSDRSGASNTGYTSSDDMPTEWPADDNLYNRAYAKFREVVGDHASVGIALAEGHESMTMISNRLVQMVKFTSALTRGRFGDAAKALGVSLSKGKIDRLGRARRKFRNSPKFLANTYLEYHFGWDPLMKDIYEAAEALSSPFLPHEVKVSVKARIPTSSTFVHANRDGIESWHWEDATLLQTIRLQCGVLVLNSNLARAQQMGVINPATIVWEKIPFSFVADWFVNVGDFLASYTDFAGLQFVNPQRTITTRYTRSSNSIAVYQPDSFFNYVTHTNESWNKSSVMEQRVLGTFPGPELTIRRLRSPSVTRGLTAVSLLIQQMRSFR